MVKIQILLCIHAVWSEYSLGTFWIAKDTKFPDMDSEVSDLTFLSPNSGERRNDLMATTYRFILKIVSTPQPLYNTIVGVHNINRVN